MVRAVLILSATLALAACGPGDNMGTALRSAGECVLVISQTSARARSDSIAAPSQRSLRPS